MLALSNGAEHPATSPAWCRARSPSLSFSQIGMHSAGGVQTAYHIVEAIKDVHIAELAALRSVLPEHAHRDPQLDVAHLRKGA